MLTYNITGHISLGGDMLNKHMLTGNIEKYKLFYLV